MKITSKHITILVFSAMIGGIGLSMLMGWWQTHQDRTPAKYTEGKFAGLHNPEDIRGSYTFGDLTEFFDVPLSDYQIAFRLPEDNPEAVRLSDLEEYRGYSDFEVGTGSVKLFTALYAGLPYEQDISDEAWLLPEAVEILKEKAILSAEQIAYLDTHVAVGEPAVSISTLPESQTTIDPENVHTPMPKETGSGSGQEIGHISGNTTFGDLLSWGVEQYDIEVILNTSMPAGAAIIKDWATANGFQFGTLKAQLQALVDGAVN